MHPKTTPDDATSFVKGYAMCRLPHRDFVAEIMRILDLARQTAAEFLTPERPYEPLSFLEVGVREGDSFAAAWDAVGHLGRVVLVDTWGAHHGGTGRGSHSHIDREIVDPRFAKQQTIVDLEYLDEDSGTALPRLGVLAKAVRTIPRDNPHVFDVVHVDGDHSFDGALRDVTNGWELTRSALIVHDLWMPTVAAALRAFSTSEARDEIRDVDASLMDNGSIVFWRGGDR